MSCILFQQDVQRNWMVYLFTALKTSVYLTISQSLSWSLYTLYGYKSQPYVITKSTMKGYKIGIRLSGVGLLQ